MPEKNVQTRKLIRWGSSKTLIMSVPRPWIKKHELSDKDEVQVIENSDDSLLILPAKTTVSEKKLETEILVKDELDLETTKYIILTKYIDGWDSIVIRAKRGLTFSPNFYKGVQEMIKPLLGLEIISVLKDKITINDIYSVQEGNIFNLVKIISQNTLEFFQNLIELIKTPPATGAVADAVDRILPNRDMVTKYYYRIHRELRKALLKPSNLSKMNMNAQDVLDFAFFINAVNQSAENIELELHNMKISGIPSIDIAEVGIDDFVARAYKFFEQGIDSFLFKKTSDAVSCLTSHKNFLQQKRTVENALDKVMSTNTLVFQVVLDMTEKIVDATRTIALSALRRIA